MKKQKQLLRTSVVPDVHKETLVSLPEERPIVPERTIKRYNKPIYSHEEAQQLVAELLQLTECIDARENTFSVEAYFAVDATTRTKLPKGCRVVPTPRYFPGDLATLHWYFLTVASGSKVRIVHLSCQGSSEYRYFIVDQSTQTSGWIDEQGLDPLETTDGL